jgi:hypothetical protein
MKATFNEDDILSLLTKVKIFNHQIGTYQLFTINDSFNYVLKLTNGTIFFTIEELEANASETLNLEMLTAITRRFTPKESDQEKAIRNVEEIPVTVVNKTVPNLSTSKTSSYRIIIRILILALIGLAIGVLVFYLIQLNSSRSNHNYQSDYEELPQTNDRYQNDADYNEPEQKTDAELRQELLEREQSNPLEYITAEINWRPTLLSNVLVTGRIYNNASEATYKNVQLHVKILTETGYELGDHYYTVTEFIEPNHSKLFEFRAVGNYGKAGDLKLEVVDSEVE